MNIKTLTVHTILVADQSDRSVKKYMDGKHVMKTPTRLKLLKYGSMV